MALDKTPCHQKKKELRQSWKFTPSLLVMHVTIRGSVLTPYMSWSNTFGNSVCKFSSDEEGINLFMGSFFSSSLFEEEKTVWRVCVVASRKRFQSEIQKKSKTNILFSDPDSFRYVNTGPNGRDGQEAGKTKYLRVINVLYRKYTR